jgi:putative transposase
VSFERGVALYWRIKSKESRKEWMTEMFKKAGRNNSNVKNFQFWQQNNKPIEIWSLKVFEQKL